MSENRLEHFRELLKGFSEGMLVTKNDDGELHGRPMVVAQLEEDGVIYLSTSLRSPKLKEIEQDPRVAVYFQKPRCYVAVNGSVEVVQDRAKIAEMWQESWRVWFPEGKDSPDLCLLRITPSHGEYWDLSGTKGVQFLFESAKSYLTGKKMDRGEGNAKVAM